jgi:hypothetical protein
MRCRGYLRRNDGFADAGHEYAPELLSTLNRDLYVERLRAEVPFRTQ